jgi:hypothetical protein
LSRTSPLTQSRSGSVTWTLSPNRPTVESKEYYSDQIVEQIQAGKLPVHIDLPGRKGNENDIEGEYFTFIHKDASDALEKYFEEYRG